MTASPHVVIDELTALSQPLRPGGYDDWLQTTNALRRDVTPALVEAAQEAGASRVIAQSAAFTTAPTGPDIVDPSAPLYLDAPKPLIGTISSNAALEAAVTQAEDIDGVVLRYGFLYGPGTTYAPDGDLIKQLREGEFPIVGNGEGRFPFIHAHDAAAATVLALDHGSTGIYNVVDDNPAPIREWVPYVADLLGAPRPATISAERAERQLAHYGTELRGASNDKARRELASRRSTRTRGTASGLRFPTRRLRPQSTRERRLDELHPIVHGTCNEVDKNATSPREEQAELFLGGLDALGDRTTEIFTATNTDHRGDPLGSGHELRAPLSRAGRRADRGSRRTRNGRRRAV